jgi:hypothetical protein
MPFPTHAEALAAARTAAAEQRVPGHTEVIEYEDEHGRWHTETAAGRDRPGDRSPRYELNGIGRTRRSPAPIRGLSRSHVSYGDIGAA